MWKTSLVLIVLITSLVSLVYGNKDRPVDPIQFEFIVESGDTIRCGQDSILERISNKIIAEKIILKEAIIKFEYKQVITIKYNDNKIISFEIHKRLKRINVPMIVLSNFTEIDYYSFYGLYNQNENKLFNRNHFELLFVVESDRRNEQLTQIMLIFSHNKFKDGYIKYSSVGSYVKMNLN